ncbi:MAG: AraC family transcriptional regulator [Phaeodactylibacter sp.]|nr:AraC family transcriptional regulator [Phaeodactylibacter sp.]
MSKDKYLREEYQSRINTVLDYIEYNLDGELTLERLAGLANFSPFHFHRIFRAMVGEPLNQFIQRIRVEKAAMLLVAQPKRSITEIALDCGFSGPATFARSFREAFGMSASQWRSGGGAAYRKERKSKSKIGKTDGKPGKAAESSTYYIADEFNNQKWKIMISNKIKAKVEVREFPEMHVAYVRHVGPYQGNEKLFEELFGKVMKWAGPRGLLQFPKTMMLSVYHDNPDVTDDEKLRLTVGITVPEDTEVEGEVGKMALPAGKYAVARFELLSDEYQEAWDAVYGQWLPDSGYQPADSPCFELYHNDPKQHPEGKHIVDICIPVKPL